MEINSYRYIKRLILPAGWLEEPCEEGTIGFRSLRIFHPPDSPDVRMEFLYRGLPVDETVTKAFRKLLDTTPHLVFDRSNLVKPTETDLALFKQLRDLLGNAGNNQLVNTRTDYLGPSFIAERIDTLAWNGKNVLAVRGWFRDAESDVRVYDFCGLFIDGNPPDPECQVEEIFLEASSQELYLRHLPSFQQSLKSLEWM
jgi:hypothetical protein